MALKGQKRRFAEAIVSAKPKKPSNREIALMLGCTEKSASASGSRWAADREVREYVTAHWPEYYAKEQKNQPAKTAHQEADLPFFCADSVCEWLKNGANESDLAKISAMLHPTAEQPAENQPPADFGGVAAWISGVAPDDVAFREVLKAVCDKLKVSCNPVDYWDSVLIDPWATDKAKAQAAADKAKYTIAKPASASKKESELERAQSLREQRRQVNAVGDFFMDDGQTGSGHSDYKMSIPQWKN